MIKIIGISKRIPRPGEKLSRFAAMTILAAVMVGGAFAASPKISKDLENATADSAVDVIIQFTAPVQQKHLDLVNGKGGQTKAVFPKIKGGAFRVPSSALAELANSPDVAYISTDRKLGAKLDLTAATINASVAWNS